MRALLQGRQYIMVAYPISQTAFVKCLVCKVSFNTSCLPLCLYLKYCYSLRLGNKNHRTYYTTQQNMSRRCYVETGPDGLPQFVTVKRSRSYHHHNHRHSCEYYKVTRKEWRALNEQNQLLYEANQAFGVQNDQLRHRVTYAEDVVIPDLKNQIVCLTAENNSLRCPSPDKSWHKNSKLEKENKKLREENADLRFRLGQLSQQLDQSLNRRVTDLAKEVEYWKNQTAFWKNKFDDLKERHVGLLAIVDAKSEKIREYEHKLRRRCVV